MWARPVGRTKKKQSSSRNRVQIKYKVPVRFRGVGLLAWPRPGRVNSAGISGRGNPSTTEWLTRRSVVRRDESGYVFPQVLINQL